MINKKYVSQKDAVATYNYTDIADMTGFRTFYGVDTTDDGTQSYHLVSNGLHSDTAATEGNGSSGEEKVHDIDFDLSEFQLPQVVSGTMRAVVPVILGHETTANKGGQAYVIIKLRKWDGTTETEIASNTKSRVSGNPGSLDTLPVVFNIHVDVPGTSFKKGEQLRITVEVWATSQAANGLRIVLSHDPTDTNNAPDSAEFITSILQFEVPFKLEEI